METGNEMADINHKDTVDVKFEPLDNESSTEDQSEEELQGEYKFLINVKTCKLCY